MLLGLYPHMLNAFLLAVLLILAIRRLAGVWRLVDIPDPRKRHEGMIPLCGGIAIFAAFLLSTLGFDGALQGAWNWEIGLGLFVLIGMADDRWPLPALPRLAGQTVAALLLLWGLTSLPLNVGQLPGGEAWLLSPLVGVALGVFFLVGTVNAVNMLDGVDGLAGSSAAAALFWLALIAHHGGHATLALHAFVLLSAVVGFLVFNLRHPWQQQASVFLGDGGSLMLGAALAFFVLSLSTGNGALAFPALLWIVIVPVADTLSLIVRRLANRRSPLSPDRWHLHHLLLKAGFSPNATTALLFAATALCGAIACCGTLLGVPDSIMAAGLIVPLAAHTVLVRFLLSRTRQSSLPRVQPTITPAKSGALSYVQVVRDKP